MATAASLSRTAVVLLHSGGGSRRQWRRLTDLLAGRYHILAPDLYGHGETGPWTKETGPRLADYAASSRS
jgi:pimeloyl-ACP methyl ester carboxylesterase